MQALEGEYPESVGISLFPRLPPWRSEAVTEVGLGWSPGRARVTREPTPMQLSQTSPHTRKPKAQQPDTLPPNGTPSAQVH